MSRILVPDYFEAFQCKCGDCRHPCCDGWGIHVSEREYFNLIGLTCGERLRHRLDDAFTVDSNATDDAYASIHPNYIGQCPMLDDDGLCLLQKEKGEQVMPLICRIYPRAVRTYGDLHEICMSCSCEETAELLFRSREALTLHEVDIPLPFDGLTVYTDQPEKDRIRHGMIALISDPSKPIGKRLELVGNAVCGEEAPSLTPRSDALAALLGLLTRLCRVSAGIREYGEDVLARFADLPKEDALRLFDAAEAHLYAILPDAEIYAGLMIANHMLYESFPFVPDASSPDTAFAALCTAVGILKLLCAVGMENSTDLTRLTDIFAAANRFIEHSDFYRICSRLSHPRGMEVFARFVLLLSRGEA